MSSTTFWILFFLVCFILGILIVHILDHQKIKLHRWIYGVISFTIILVPLICFPMMPNFIKYVLYLLCGIFAVMFFEASRISLERNEIRGIVRSEQFYSNKNK